MRLYREGWRNGLEGTSELSLCTVTSALLLGLGTGKGEAYTSEGTQADRAVGSTALFGSCPILPGSRWVGESYSKILSTKTHLRPAMQRQRLSRQARIGAMQIFSELRQPFSRSASRHTQQVAARPAIPWTLLSSLWVPGMLSSAGSPSRDASGLSWAEGLGKVSAATSDMFKHQLSNSSPPKGLNSITVHYCETQTKRDGSNSHSALQKSQSGSQQKVWAQQHHPNWERSNAQEKWDPPCPSLLPSPLLLSLPLWSKSSFAIMGSCLLATFIIP